MTRALTIAAYFTYGLAAGLLPYMLRIAVWPGLHPEGALMDVMIACACIGFLAGCGFAILMHPNYWR